MVASFLSPHVGFACGGKVLFSGEDRYRTHFMCVWFWELMKQSGASVSGVLLGSRCVCVWFVMVCFVLWHAVGCLEQHKYCCSMDYPW